MQVSSPQIMTEGQTRRQERKSRRQLSFNNNVIEELKEKINSKDEKLKTANDKKTVLMSELKEKRTRMSEINNRCKQLTADIKKVQEFEKEREKTQKVLQTSTSMISELLDENNELESSVNQLSETLSGQKLKTRSLQKKVYKLKINKKRWKTASLNYAQKLSQDREWRNV